MLASISIIPDQLTNKLLLRGLWLCLTTTCLCIHVPIHHLPGASSRLCFASIQTQTCRVNAQCAKQIGALCTRKACLGLVILKLKACLFVQPQFQERGMWMWMCRTREGGGVGGGRGTQSERCDFHSKGITPTLLSIPLNQETSGRKGRRIRLARERKREWVL